MDVSSRNRIRFKDTILQNQVIMKKPIFGIFAVIIILCSISLFPAISFAESESVSRDFFETYKAWGEFLFD